MTTPKKKHLIELMIEANIKWPVDAKYAAQDKRSNRVYFYVTKPNAPHGSDCYVSPEGSIGECFLLTSLCRNWHQTIITREQYEQALADATISIEDSHCNSVISQIPDKTIEQLTNDYYAKAAEAKHLQATADKASKLASEALDALQKTGELLGLVISPRYPQKYTEQHQQPIITDWHDLQIGDVILCISQGPKTLDELNWIVGEECEVVGLEEPGKSGQPIRAKFKNGEKWWIGEFRFIRRP